MVTIQKTIMAPSITFMVQVFSWLQFRIALNRMFFIGQRMGLIGPAEYKKN